ncbi:MAG: glycoside hydrolase family 127 protein, partial [Clostridia bacterium]|nr:glycoside hydrolase family 127 protein [Clostridia bacterium]
IPGWCQKYTLKSNGSAVKTKPVNGFVYIKCEGKKEVIELDLQMKATLIEANPLIEENFGRVAVSYGPFIYCLEDIDADRRISEISLSKNLNETVKYVEFFKANILEVDAFVQEKFDGLYRPLKNEKTPARIMLIPYYTFANRGESDMAVWLRLAR